MEFSYPAKMAAVPPDEKKALLSPEYRQLLMQGADDRSSIAAVSSPASSRHASLAMQPSSPGIVELQPPRKLFVKRGSLTINSLPQQFNYHEPSSPLDRCPSRHTEEEFQIAADVDKNDGALPKLSVASKEQCLSQNQLDGDDSDADVLDDSADAATMRQSSSSTKSAQVPSWRPWIDTSCCFGYIRLRCTWIFHPQGPLSYMWLMIVSLAVLFNVVHIPLRFAFCGWNMTYHVAASTEEILTGSNISSALTAIPSMFTSEDLAFWMVPDYFCDLIYAIDILKSMRTGFFDEGFMNAHPQAIFSHYVGSASFYADVVSLLPLDLLYLSFGLNSLLRLPRLIKMYRCFQFIGWTERHTRWPNVARSTKMFLYVLIICHWNAALCKTALQGYEKIWFSKTSMHHDPLEDIVKVTTVPPSLNGTVKANVFLESAAELRYYWAWLYVSVSTLCTLGLSGSSGLAYDEPPFIFAFLTLQMMMGLVLFAVTIGEILLIVDNLGAGRREFQMHLDAVKNYMGKRDIPKPVRSKVIRWFDYIWESKRGFDEERRHLMVLPECLQADISLHAYLHTLKRVEFFQNTEAGFLKELVLKLKPILFSPGEYICRKGEIGRQMYLIEVGLLQVFSGKHVNTKPVAHLRKGQYFGELSILNMGKAGNRRTATIRSVGYSHLLSLCKEDLLAVLHDFPKERARLEFFAAKRLEKYQHERQQEKLKRQHSRETLSQDIVHETEPERHSWQSNSRCLLESECHTEITSGFATNGQRTTNQSQATTSSSADGNEHEAEKGDVWLPGPLLLPRTSTYFTSECDLSPEAMAAAMGTRRSSLTSNLTPKKNSYRARKSNLLAKLNSMPHTGSPLVRRMARSVDVIDGRESVL